MDVFVVIFHEIPVPILREFTNELIEKTKFTGDVELGDGLLTENVNVLLPIALKELHRVALVHVAPTLLNLTSLPKSIMVVNTEGCGIVKVRVI